MKMVFSNLRKLLEQPLYDLPADAKKSLFKRALREVVVHHTEHCKPYGTLCAKRGFDPRDSFDVRDVPYLPVSLFKNQLLLSVPEGQIYREINSSATTSGNPSRMGLDRQTSSRQAKCFTKVILERLGNRRRRFVVLDLAESISRTNRVSARSSTIKSLLFGASEVDTCVNSAAGKLVVNEEKLDALLTRAERDNEEIVIFGFTYILYASVVRQLKTAKKRYRLPGSKVVHIGGWKKLESEKVSPEQLISDCCQVFGVSKQDVVDLYGFTEQGGMIYPTCEHGSRHIPVWGEVVVRDPLTLEPLPPGREGLMQFVSPIQTSYPGHAVLTEDVGLVEHVDDCPCGRKGTTFRVVGRSSTAKEVRGCGDIMAAQLC